MDSNEIKLDGGLALVNALSGCNTLEYLMVDGNMFGEEGCQKIMKNLQESGKQSVIIEINDDLGSDDESEEEQSPKPLFCQKSNLCSADFDALLESSKKVETTGTNGGNDKKFER